MRVWVELPSLIVHHHPEEAREGKDEGERCGVRGVKVREKGERGGVEKN